MSALNKRDQEGATEEKFKVEDRQREEARMREADGVEWTPRFFRPVDPVRGEEEGLDWILSAHMFVLKSSSYIHATDVPFLAMMRLRQVNRLNK